jgi:hypothetical protein
MAFTWVISQLETIPTLDGMDKVIKTIHYRAQKQVGDLNWTLSNNQTITSFTADTYGGLEIEAPHETSFIPYDEITKEMVEGWLEAGLNTEEIEANLDAQIENFLNPPVVAYPLPWNNN